MIKKRSKFNCLFLGSHRSLNWSVYRVDFQCWFCHGLGRFHKETACWKAVKHTDLRHETGWRWDSLVFSHQNLMLIDLTATWWFPWLENPVPFLETLQGRQKLEKRCLLPRKASGEERFGDKGVKCQGFPVEQHHCSCGVWWVGNRSGYGWAFTQSVL